jgi:hypothetical protein
MPIKTFLTSVVEISAVVLAVLAGLLWPDDD